MSETNSRKRVLVYVVMGSVLMSVGFLAGFGYTVATLVDPVGTQSATDPNLIATLQSSARIQSELHDEMAALRRDLGVRERRAARAAASEASAAAAPAPRVARPEAAGTRAAPRLPSERPELSAPHEAKLHADLLAAAQNEKDAGRRAAALRALKSRFGSEAPPTPTPIGQRGAKPSEVRGTESTRDQKSTEGSK